MLGIKINGDIKQNVNKIKDEKVEKSSEEKVKQNCY